MLLCALRAPARVALLFAALALTGCQASSLRVVVRTTENANQQRPFYALIRTVDQKTYAAESYQAVADKVVAPDASVLKAEVIYPGGTQEIDVPMPKKLPVAVYFLLSEPDTTWKTLLEQPLPARAEFRFGTEPATPPRPAR